MTDQLLWVLDRIYADDPSQPGAVCYTWLGLLLHGLFVIAIWEGWKWLGRWIDGR